MFEVFKEGFCYEQHFKFTVGPYLIKSSIFLITFVSKVSVTFLMMHVHCGNIFVNNLICEHICKAVLTIRIISNFSINEFAEV